MSRVCGVTGTRRDGMPEATRSILVCGLAAVLEIGDAWLVGQDVREHRGMAWIGVGIVALGAYGFVATFPPDPNFERILAAYGGCRCAHVHAAPGVTPLVQTCAG